VCTECGENYLQWQGRCTNCGTWNSLKEITVSVEATRPNKRAGYAGQVSATVLPLRDVLNARASHRPTGIGEVDRVLGGGIVPGSVILLGGDPGIGKSTLLLQVAARAGKVLYVSGEESPEQIKLRADRIGVSSDSLFLLAATDVHAVQAAIDEQQPDLLIIDSIQTMYDPAFPSTPGSIVQVRETAIRIQQMAKGRGLSVVLIGHITKEGTVAGPRTLEHVVDVVLYLEGEAEHNLRILRSVKNRFGDANETGLFDMAEEGLVEVANPAQFLLRERLEAPGSVLTAVLEGSRPLLIEVQALTTPSVFGYPRRTASGFDVNRLNLLIAVLQRRTNTDLTNQDVFVNIVGGLKVKDPAIDAAVCCALASSWTGVSLPEKLCILGEVGLSGEIRSVTQQQRREREVKQLGYSLPATARQLPALLQSLKLVRTKGASAA
jgi:DNA repair protein RadA/Sms